jgi:hypothetical protein
VPPLIRPTFVLKDPNALRIVGLQSDVEVTRRAHAEGALLQLADRATALDRCRLALDVAADETPDLIVLPELSVPVSAIDEIVHRVEGLPFDAVLIAGLEGIHPNAYAQLVGATGEPLDVDPVAGSYVNASLTVVKDSSGCVVSYRTKRRASGVEENRVHPCLGTSSFRVLELGPRPIRLLPLICAEFQSGIWPQIRADVGDISVDVVLVIQMNNDPDQAHPSVTLTEAFAAEGLVKNARFVLANAATIHNASDGATYLVYPPTQLRPPTYEHTRRELWHVPRANGYKGFRLPDKSGCVWQMSLRLPHAPTDAYQTIPCHGATLRVWRPATCSNKGGLAMGLMRTASAALLVQPWASSRTANAAVRDHLDVSNPRYTIGALSESSATTCLGWATLSGGIDWSTVENVVKELVECGALLGAGNRDARMSGEACNCSIGDRGLAVIHAPNEVDALATRFRLEYCLPPHSLPKGAVTFGVHVAALGASTRVVGERIRADRVTRGDDGLQGGPPKRIDSSVEIDTLNFHACQLNELRPLYTLPAAAAAAELRRLLPEVFA